MAGAPAEVIDTHIHFADKAKINYTWLKSLEEGEGLPAGAADRDWSEADYRRELAGCADVLSVTRGVYVEATCGAGPLEEARWVLGLAADPESLIARVVAGIPVPQGEAAVKAFLDELRTPDGALPQELKGGRVILFGSALDSPTSPEYTSGLHELERHGLVWEFVGTAEYLPAIVQTVRAFPNVTFVLDHLILNGFGNLGISFETWESHFKDLGALQNCVAKLGAIEEWKVSDPLPFIRVALESFGHERCMFEGNWFVPAALGRPYAKTFKDLQRALVELGATAEQEAAVFRGTAERVYGLAE